MNNYHIDAGAGFTPNMQDLFTAMSICFTLLVFMGGLINWFLLRVKAEERIMKGIILIELIIFGICFLAMAFLTFFATCYINRFDIFDFNFIIFNHIL
jgi:hypothetical protein